MRQAKTANLKTAKWSNTVKAKTKKKLKLKISLKSAFCKVVRSKHLPKWAFAVTTKLFYPGRPSKTCEPTLVAVPIVGVRYSGYSQTTKLGVGRSACTLLGPLSGMDRMDAPLRWMDMPLRVDPGHATQDFFEATHALGRDLADIRTLFLEEELEVDRVVQGGVTDGAEVGPVLGKKEKSAWVVVETFKGKKIHPTIMRLPIVRTVVDTHWLPLGTFPEALSDGAVSMSKEEAVADYMNTARARLKNVKKKIQGVDRALARHRALTANASLSIRVHKSALEACPDISAELPNWYIRLANRKGGRLIGVRMAYHEAGRELVQGRTQPRRGCDCSV